MVYTLISSVEFFLKEDSCLHPEAKAEAVEAAIRSTRLRTEKSSSEDLWDGCHSHGCDRFVPRVRPAFRAFRAFRPVGSVQQVAIWPCLRLGPALHPKLETHMEPKNTWTRLEDCFPLQPDVVNSGSMWTSNTHRVGRSIGPPTWSVQTHGVRAAVAAVNMLCPNLLGGCYGMLLMGKRLPLAETLIYLRFCAARRQVRRTVWTPELQNRSFRTHGSIT